MVFFALKNSRDPRLSARVNQLVLGLSGIGRSNKRMVSMAMVACIVMLSLWLAYTLRQSTPFTDFSSTWHLFLLLPPLTILCSTVLGIYGWMVRSSNRNLFYQLGKACLMSSVLLAVLTFLLPPDRINPRSVIVIYGLVLVCGVCLLYTSPSPRDRG